MIRPLRHLAWEGQRHAGLTAEPVEVISPLMVQRRHVEGPRWCHIGMCEEEATLVVESGVDFLPDVQLCTQHRHLYRHVAGDRVVRR